MTKQIAAVTGGMGGIGEAICVKLHDTGAHRQPAPSPDPRRASCPPIEKIWLEGAVANTATWPDCLACSLEVKCCTSSSNISARY